jgi:putative endonuclease
MKSKNKNTWTCYLLQCADNTLYCGITNDLEKRLAAHNAGEGAKYTRGRTPVKLVYRELCPDKSAALKREREIKALPRPAKLALCSRRGIA